MENAMFGIARDNRYVTVLRHRGGALIGNYGNEPEI